MQKQIGLEDAKALAVSFLARQGMSTEHSSMVADHLIYAHLAGLDYAGLSRLLPMAKVIRERGVGGDIKVLRETAKSAMIDGANVNGYVTSVIAIDKAIALAKAEGVGIVGVCNSWFSGLLRYYVERAANVGLVGIHAANSTARVAPYGGIDRLLGTNPIAFAFPSLGEPLVVDFASASTMWGDVIYHQQIGKSLPEGRAIDPQGKPTTDPASALAGAILPWGGPRGSALSVVIQALGILGGSDPIVAENGKWGYFFAVIDPELLMPLDRFKSNINAMRTQIEDSRSNMSASTVRAPGSSTQSKLAKGRTRGWIEVDEEILLALTTHEK